MRTTLSAVQMEKLAVLLHALIDQARARVVVEPYAKSPGFWFGGGNVVRDDDGTLWLVGRYRNYGDSRTGLEAGERGMECALFASTDGGQSFSKKRSWSKENLSFVDNTVLSIEGTALHRKADGGWELFVSSEKVREYPPGFEEYRKPGAGVWSIDVVSGDTPEALDPKTIRTALIETEDPAYIHVKDPVIYDVPNGDTHLVYCSHPFCWSSANSGLAIRGAGAQEFKLMERQLVSRGPAWDIASTRLTCRMPVPAVGVFAEAPPAYVFFYDGCECVREHEQSSRGVARPRGYSCEEIGGAMVGFSEEFPQMTRLSYIRPMFISSEGTGCSRYVDALVTDEGIFALWQRSRDDGSQPLVGNFLTMAQVAELLS